MRKKIVVVSIVASAALLGYLIFRKLTAKKKPYNANLIDRINMQYLQYVHSKAATEITDSKCSQKCLREYKRIANHLCKENDVDLKQILGDLGSTNSKVTFKNQLLDSYKNKTMPNLQQVFGISPEQAMYILKYKVICNALILYRDYSKGLEIAIQSAKTEVEKIMQQLLSSLGILESNAPYLISLGVELSKIYYPEQVEQIQSSSEYLCAPLKQMCKIPILEKSYNHIMSPSEIDSLWNPLIPDLLKLYQTVPYSTN